MKSIPHHKISIVIPCKNEGIYLEQTLSFLLRTEAKFISDIIIVNDNSNDNCCQFLKDPAFAANNIFLKETDGIGAAQARNLGVSNAVASDVLVFCDAHITMEPGWLNTILKCFDKKDVSAVCPGIGYFDPTGPVGYGQCWNDKFEVYWLKKPSDIQEIPLAPGGCMAIRKSVFDAVGGFDRSFRSWGYEDVELSLKLWLFGHKIFVHPGIRIGHKFRKVQPYKVDMTEFHYNRLRMAISHFNNTRIDKVKYLLKDYSNYSKVEEKILLSDSYMQRSKYLSLRLHNDDWFFNKFNIPF